MPENVSRTCGSSQLGLTFTMRPRHKKFATWRSTWARRVSRSIQETLPAAASIGCAISTRYARNAKRSGPTRRKCRLFFVDSDPVEPGGNALRGRSPIGSLNKPFQNPEGGTSITEQLRRVFDYRQ